MTDPKDFPDMSDAPVNNGYLGCINTWVAELVDATFKVSR